MKDEYDEIISMLQRLKGNKRALAYVKGWLEMLVNKYNV